ncbi:MAG: ribbon-helix-helix protein, CopG family [Patescibacteria group bacterium]|mgnify:CR=1 FL=1
MHKRLNITLPEKTVALLDRLAEKGDRSRLIDEAVRRLATEVGKANLRRELKAGALKRSGRDLAVAEEWAVLTDEPWLKRHS